MKALVLAAGYGKRLKILTSNKPKSLVKVLDIPLIFFSLYNLKKSNIKDIIINLHYKGDQIRELLGDGTKYDLQISYSFEPQILGTGGGIKKTENFFLNENKFLVLNSDVVSDIDLRKMINFHEKTSSVATLGVKGKIKKDLYYDEKNFLYSIGEKVDGKNYGVFTGIQVLDHSIFNYLKQEFSSSINAYQKYLEEGKKIMVFPFEKYFWYDLGIFETKEHFENELNSFHLEYIEKVKKEMKL